MADPKSLLQANLFHDVSAGVKIQAPCERRSDKIISKKKFAKNSSKDVILLTALAECRSEFPILSTFV